MQRRPVAPHDWMVRELHCSPSCRTEALVRQGHAQCLPETPYD